MRLGEPAWFEPARLKKYTELIRIQQQSSMSDADRITLSSEDAAARLSELLDEASGNPIGITGRDDLMVYLVSRSDYEVMLERIQFLEDQLLLSKADAARKEGHAHKKRVDALLRDFSEGANHEEAAPHKAGS